MKLIPHLIYDEKKVGWLKSNNVTGIAGDILQNIV